MKKIANLLFIVIVLFVTVFSSSAQATEEKTESQSKNNWFISLGAGPNLLQGEQDGDKKLSERFRYSGEFSVGKWFNPYFGSRLQVVGGSLRGFNYMSDHEGKYVFEDRNRRPFPVGYYPAENWDKFKKVDDGFWQEFNYATVSFDLMANFTNLFFGSYREKNVVDFIPYVGVGFIHGFSSVSNPNFNNVFVDMGGRANFNLSPQWSIYLEPQVIITSTELDGYAGNRPHDLIGNLLVGLQFNINKKFKQAESLLTKEEVSYINNRINDNRSLIENQQNILERQQDLLERLESRPVQKEVVEPQSSTPSSSASGSGVGKFLPSFIYFQLDSYKIPFSEQSKLRDVILYLKEHPDSKLLLVGYADKKTGNISHNLKLSKKRAEAVANELKYQGLNPNRLLTEWRGDSEQPFAQNDWNRVVILLER
ncbi:MAG: OmpA family protein [Dysgonamonadaceae bacterium]|jgi:outer membrane protein OmpA-like peptidoglycan-associated protein|nr:OmpA family protein [Dysgonamonadaceae bacterium]